MYAQIMKKSIYHIPKTALMTIYGKERTKLILEGRKVLPKRTINYGFKFEYCEVEKALKHLMCSCYE